MNAERKKLVLVNIFTPKPGKLEEFLALQTAGLPVLREGVPRARGTRLYRAEDGSKAMLLSVFDTADDYRRITESAAFLTHRQQLIGLLAGSEPTRYELIYEAGEA
jgi:hypothetical protein